jgi:PAS domain S-box-containing protein
MSSYLDRLVALLSGAIGKVRPVAGTPKATTDAAAEQITSAFENVVSGIALCSPDYGALKVNRAFCDFLGYTPAEMSSLALLDIVHPDDLEEDRRQRALLLAGHKDSFQREKRYRHKRGHILWASFSCILVRDASGGAPLHFILQAQDITARRQAALALRASEERFRSLTALASDWYWELDAQFRCTLFMNNEQPVRRRAGYPDPTGRCPWDLPGLSPLGAPWEGLRTMLQTQQAFRNIELVDLGGARGPQYMSVSGEPTFDAAGHFSGYRGTGRRITDRKRSEQRLRDTQAMLNMAAQVGRLGGWALDAVDLKLTWSEEVGAIHEVRQRGAPTATEALNFFLPEYREQIRSTFLTSLRDGSPFETEAEILTAKGRRVWVRMLGEAEWDAQGRVRRLQGALQDISEAKQAQAEVLRLNAQLEERVRQRTTQLESANRELEAFSYSIAHDLRAPLSSIDGFSRVLEEHAGGALDDRGRHYLSRIRAGVRQMNDLSEGLLALAHLSRASLRSERVDLAGLARAELAACQERSPERSVATRVAPSLPAEGDPRLLLQVISNLVGNAWKFTSRQPQAAIEVGGMAGDNGQPVYFVRDNGAGFDMAYASKIFEAFHRMHSSAEFEGTGIGLAIVHKVIRRHGGRIWAESAPGQGTTFYFTLGQPAT